MQGEINDGVNLAPKTAKDPAGPFCDVNGDTLKNDQLLWLARGLFFSARVASHRPLFFIA